MNLAYVVIETKEQLDLALDDLGEAARNMVQRTSGGTSAEVIIQMMLKTVGTLNHFLVCAYDEDEKFRGFCYAILMAGSEPWVDVVGIHMTVGIGCRTVRHEVFEFLKAWAHKRGAHKIVASIVRNPRVFYEHFHKPLGFKPIGLIVEYDLTKEPNDA